MAERRAGFVAALVAAAVMAVGLAARFNPDAEVLAPGGRTVAREGEEVSFGGGTITDAFEICTIEGEDFRNPAP